jgi:uncharacterized membrane protein
MAAGLRLRGQGAGDKMTGAHWPQAVTEVPKPLAIDAAEDGAPRLAAIDFARGAAIVAMVVYHAAFDLSAARLIATDVSSDLAWKLFARLTAGTFLFIVGFSLVLATRGGFRRDAYLRRLALIAGGAALVTISTWWFDPATFVFFGILHEIALASVLALPFLRLPTAIVALAAAAVLALPWYFASPVFDWWPLWWVGLSTAPPVTVDYVPLFPWFGVVLAGIVGGRLLVTYGQRLWRFRPEGAPWTWLIVAGRWSLVIYLVHQPLLVGAVSLAARIAPPNEAVVRTNFMGECTAACTADRDAATCMAFCGCMFSRLYGTPLFAKNSFADMTPADRDEFDGILAACTAPPPQP